MIIILDGIVPEPVDGTVRLHTGTRDYLRRIGARLIERSEREVPEHHVDIDGRYLPADDANGPDTR